LLDTLVMLPVLGAFLAVGISLVAPRAGPMFPTLSHNPNAAMPFPGILWIELTVIGCIIATGVVMVAYETVMTVRYGRTLGKAWLGIRPIRTHGGGLGWARALARTSIYWLAGFLLNWVGLLDDLWCLWDANQQCLHDKAADSIVINDPGSTEHAGAPSAMPWAGTGPAPVPSVSAGPGWHSPPRSEAVTAQQAPTPANQDADAPSPPWPSPSWPAPLPPRGYPPPGGYGGYPPQSYSPYGPGVYSAAGYPVFPGHSPSPKTSGFAIASLVLSIVLWGIGSVLGIIFGFVALRRIKEKGGAEKGRGLAIAGISVGFGGIVLGIVLAISLVVVFAHLDHENVVPMGTTVNFTNCGCGSSLSTLTVTNLTEVPSSVVGPPPSGDRLWVAGVDACEIADPADNGPDGPELYDLAAKTTGGSVYSPANEVPPGETNILNTTLRPSQCVSGYASFWVPRDETIAGIEYNPDGPFSRYEWKQP
jgi:uncharacterized RDD family membrane protein YckC